MKFGTLVFALMLFVLPLRLSASLGGGYDSVEADRAKMQASLQTTSRNSYEIHELQGSSGVTVREYVSSPGNVFGVAWKGRVPPNLQQLLGVYYSQYLQDVKQLQAKRRGHGPMVVRESGFVVEVSGRARAFVGRAYVPRMMPTGVTAHDIQ